MADIFSALATRKTPRQAYFDKMLAEGTNSTPIQHWSQGASRLAHAMLAGMEMSSQRDEEKAAQAQWLKMPGLEEPTAPVAAAPPVSPVVGALAGDGIGGKIVSAESGGDPLAKNPRSSASGPGQFIDSTWLETVKRYRPDLAAGKDDAMVLALRSDPTLSREMTDAYAVDNRGALSKRGLPVTPGSTYLAHFAGPGGASKLLSADPATPVAALLSPAAIKANPHIADMSAGDIRAWADKKMGGGPSMAAAGDDALPPNARPAEGYVIPGMPGQAPARSPVQIDPAMRTQIREMLSSPNKAIQQQGMELYKQFAKPREETRPLTDPRERARYGIQASDTNPYQVDAKGEVKPINPQPFAVNVNQQAESEFSKKGAELSAKRYDELAQEGPKARQMMSDVGLLRDLGDKIRTGKIAEVKAVLGPYAEALGVKVEGLSEIQAFEAVVARVAPNLRVPGTGAQSDFELRNFLKAMPTLGNTPEGNALVERTLSGLYKNKAEAAKIGSAVLRGEITRKEADERLENLADPMEEYRKFSKTSKTAPAGGAGPSVDDLVKKYLK